MEDRNIDSWQAKWGAVLVFLFLGAVFYWISTAIEELPYETKEELGTVLAWCLAALFIAVFIFGLLKDR